MQSLYIIKIGGNVINQADKLTDFLQGFARIPMPKILVHGGGAKANQLLDRLKIEPKMIDGRRITDSATLEIVVMVYAGWVNKTIVAQLQSLHCNALGFTGADANIIVSEKRAAFPIDYGFAGDIQRVDDISISEMLENEICPVVAPVTHDGKGQLLNTNADNIASHLAVAMAPHFQTQLCLCFEKSGVLKDANDDRTLIETIHLDQIPKLKEKKILQDGIIPKVDMAAYAINNGVHAVHICHFREVSKIPNPIKGTLIHREL